MNRIWHRLAGVLFVVGLLIGTWPIPSSAFSIGGLKIDLNELKNDSKVVQDVFDSVVKEGVKLVLNVKDLKPALVKDASDNTEYSGISLSSESKAESFAVLGAGAAQKHNLQLNYTWKSQKSGFYTSYSTVINSLLGKDYVKKNLESLMSVAQNQKPGVELSKELGTQWQVVALYGKTADGQSYMKLKLSTLFKSEMDALKNVVKNSEVSYEPVSTTKHGIIIKDKSKKLVVAKVYTDFKLGEMVVSTRGDQGQSVFKQVINTAFKQIDSSGKTTFDSVFSKELSIFSEYEKYAKNAKSYKLINQAGQSKSIASESQLLKPLAEKFNLGPNLTTKDGVPALKVRSGLIEGTVYFKEGFVNFSFTLWPISK